MTYQTASGGAAARRHHQRPVWPGDNYGQNDVLLDIGMRMFTPAEL